MRFETSLKSNAGSCSDRRRDPRQSPSRSSAWVGTVAVIVLLLSAAGCGSDAADGSTGTAATATDPSTTMSPTTEPAPTSTVRSTTTSEPATPVDPACATLQEPISSLSVDLAGLTRTALVHMPADIPPTSPTPVVLSFHGAGDGTGKLDEWDGLVELADTEGFIVVHPQGSAIELFPGYHVDPAWDILRLGVDEAAFVGTLLDQLALELCVDTRRVYATGFSNGGSLALALSCTMGERITAIAAVAASPIYFCPTPQPVPTVIFHGLDDQVVPYGGGGGASSIEQMAGDVAVRNGCAATAATVVTIAPGIDQLSWAECAAPTELFRIASNGHAWPGGYEPPFSRAVFADLLVESGTVPSTLTPEQAADNVFLSNPDIDATEVMWRFFVDSSTHA